MLEAVDLEAYKQTFLRTRSEAPEQFVWKMLLFLSRWASPEDLERTDIPERLRAAQNDSEPPLEYDLR